MVRLRFEGELVHWRGPSPFHFVAVPADGAREIRAIAAAVTYGWGVVPARVRIGATEWTTALFPKDGGYLVPIRDDVRRAEALALGDHPLLQLDVPG